VHRRDWVWYLSGRMVRRYGGFFFQLCCRAANKSWRWRYERDEPASPAIATDGAIEQGVMNETLDGTPARCKTVVQTAAPMRRLITRGRGRHPHLAVDDSSVRACSGRVSHGLRALPQVRLDRLPRMADFGLWAPACETTLARRHVRGPTRSSRHACGHRVRIDGVCDRSPATGRTFSEGTWSAKSASVGI